VTDTAGERLNEAADLIPGLGRINLNLTELTDACVIFCELTSCVPSISSVSSQSPFDPSAPAPPLSPTGPFFLTSSTPYLTTDYNAPTHLVPDSRLASVLRKFVAGPGIGAFGNILFNALANTLGRSQGTGTPEALTDKIKIEHSGGQGVPDAVYQVNAPAPERLSGFFQDTWLSRLLTYDPATGEYYFTCQQAATLKQDHPELWALLQPNNGNNFDRPLMQGAGSFTDQDFGATMRFKLSGSQLVPSGNALSAIDQYKLSFCVLQVAEFYHVALHIAAQTMQFASQDFAPKGRSPDPFWRLFTPGRQTTAVKGVQAEVLLTQSGSPVPEGFSRLTNGFLYTTTFPGETIATMKDTIDELFSDPCSPDRWMPAGAPESDHPHFVPLLQSAQQVVCEEGHQLTIPDSIVQLFRNRLVTLGGYSPANIESWMPPVTAIMIGLEHTMTLSWQILFGTDVQDGNDGWEFSGPSKFSNKVLTAAVTVMPADIMKLCNGSATVNTDETSVTNEMIQNGEYLAAHGKYAAFTDRLTKMKDGLLALWAEVDSMPTPNATFVYQTNRCVTSSTWI